MKEILLGGGDWETILLFVCFMLSQWGWWCFFRKHCSVSAFFLPSLSACFQITVLTCAGMGGWLLQGSRALFFFGAAYLLYGSIRRCHPSRALPVMEFLFLVCMAVLVFQAVKGRVLYAHDNFSHWGTMIAELLRSDRFPDGRWMLTDHFTYPLGSSVWIYYVCRLIRVNSDEAWMFAQALLMLYCVLPLFCFLPKDASPLCRGMYFLLVVLLTNCALCYNIQIFNLMVDTELPLVGAAATLFAFYAKEGSEKKWDLWCLSAYLCALMQIKISGIFFVLAVVAILLLKRSVWTDRRSLCKVGGAVGISLIPLVLWKIYCRVYFAGFTAKHEGSLTSFLRISAQKSIRDILGILHGAVRYFLRSSYLKEFLVVLAVAILIVWIISSRDDFRTAGKVWGFLLAVYLVYTAATAVMYVVSMPLIEALELMTINRYQMTVLIYCYYIVFCTLLYSLFRGNRLFAHADAARSLTLLGLLLLLAAGWKHRGNGDFITLSENYGGIYLEPRIQCETALREAGVPERAKCMVLTPGGDIIHKSMLTFFLGSDRKDITQVVVESPDQLLEVDKALEEDIWVIVADTENDMIQTWLSQRDHSHIVVVAS